MTQKTKTLLVVLAALALLAVLLLAGMSAGGVKLLGRDEASTAEKRLAYLADCGWTADPATEQVQQILIPETFSPMYESYNDLQCQQGFDLAKYAGRDCTLYTYQVTNYPDKEQNVLAELYVYRDRVIGGDIHSTALDGFMIGLK